MSKKGIIITIRPEHYCNILNGIKKGELRVNQSLKNAINYIIERFGDCFIYAYCSIACCSNDFVYYDETTDKYVRGHRRDGAVNGRIKFGFKVKEIVNVDERDGQFVADGMLEGDILDFICLDKERLASYSKNKKPYIIVFGEMKIYDTPLKTEDMRMYQEDGKILKYVKAPQNFAYVAVRSEDL